MANSLFKVARSAGNWVPSVTRSGSRMVTKTHGTVEVGKVFYEYYPHSALPSTMRLVYGNPMLIFNNVRTLPGRRESWMPSMGGLQVRVEPLIARKVTSHEREDYTIELEPGYWEEGPATPAWTASANSIANVRAPWEATFKVPTEPLGLIVGVSEAGAIGGADATVGGEAGQRIKYGLRFEGSDVFVWNNAEGEYQELTPARPWDSGSVYSIRSFGDRVVYSIDGTPIARTTFTPAPDQPNVQMTAALYGPKDWVDDPTLKALQLNEATGNIALNTHMRGHAPGAADSSSGAIRMHLRVRGNNFTTRLSLGTLSLRGRDTADGGHIKIPHKLLVYGHGMTAGVGRGALKLRMRAAGSGYDDGTGYGALRVSPLLLGTMVGVRHELNTVTVGLDSMDIEQFPGGMIYAPVTISDSMGVHLIRAAGQTERMSIRPSITTSRVVIESLRERLRVGASISGGLIVDAQLLHVITGTDHQLAVALVEANIAEVVESTDTLTIDRLVDAVLLERADFADGMTTQQMLEVAMNELLAFVAAQSPGANVSVYSVVPDEEPLATGSTTYDNYPFTSFANIGGRYFGASESGIYELQGEDDDGQPINALIDMGLQDFGTKALKGVTHAYVSTNAPTPLKLKVRDGDQGPEYVYVTRSASPAMQTQRFDLGKGLRAHYFGLQITNEDGSPFEFKDIEFLVHESKRRI